MPGITLEQAQARLDALLSAESLSVRIGDRQIQEFSSHADLDASIARWSRIVRNLTAQQSGQPTGYSLADFSHGTADRYRCRR